METHACYRHVVVIWRGMIIYYEFEYTLPLTMILWVKFVVSILPLLELVVVMESFHWIIFKTPWTIILLRIGESNITSKAVPLGNILSNKWVIGNINLFFYVLQQLLIFLVLTIRRISYMWFPIPTFVNIHSPFCGKNFWM